MRKAPILAYAAIAYALAMANIAYIMGFLADFGVPKTVNSGASALPLWQAIVLDALLVLGFGLHHSLTARTAFKRRWTRIVPPSLERSTYLYMTAAATGLLIVFWQPIPLTLWRVEPAWAVAAITAAYLGVWATMFAATFHFGHLGFFGLAQAWNRVRARPAPQAPFAARYLYGIIRHPISLGWMLAPWITPHLTLGQLVFAVSATAYVSAATPFEEADLIGELGDRYRRYRADVPAFVPRLRATAEEASPAHPAPEQ